MIRDEHGKIKRSYRKWSGMIRRCTSKKSHIWKYYGGRGITVCERWSGREIGYQNFLTDMGEPPEGLTLERINNDGNYEPSNCRWASMKDQAQNRRKTGKIQPGSLRQKALKAGLPYMRVYQRIHIAGWSEQAALTTPIIKKPSRLNKYGLGYKNNALTYVPKTSTEEVSKTSLDESGVSCIGHATQ